MELRKMVQVGLAGESVVGSYSYRDEVKQKTKWVEMFITGDGARESQRLQNWNWKTKIQFQKQEERNETYFQAGLHTISYIADSEGFRLL